MKWTLVLAMLLGIECTAAQSPDRVSGVEFDRSDRYLMRSESVDDLFKVDVLLPLGYRASNDSYPTVYVTDANYLLYSAAATYLAQATGEFPKLIIVGVGWDVPSITRIRVRDLTPTCDEEFQSNRNLADAECGHADDFVAFIRDELQPFVEATYRTTQDDTLVGYSFGGLFALHVLFNHTDVFDRYVIGSPSMNWDDQFVFDAEEAYFRKQKDLAKKVYLSAGGLEGDRTIPNAYLMYERLISRNYPGLDIELEVLEGETHMTSINPAVMRGLRSVLAE